MNQVVLGALFAGGLFLGILLMMQVGRYVRVRLSGKDIESTSAGLTALEGALFGLMSLILAFCFSGAGLRFDARRQLIIEEANCIGTAYLRLSLLPTQAQQDLQEKFRQYVDARLDAYRVLPDLAKAKAEIARAAAIQGEIWTRAIEASQRMDSLQATVLVLPALNAMFDIANTRYWATQIHPPPFVFWLLGVLILIFSLLAGFDMGDGKARSWIHVVSFAVLLAITFYAIVDLEFPRLGLVQVKNFDQALVDVRNNMGAGTATIIK